MQALNRVRSLASLRDKWKDKTLGSTPATSRRKAIHKGKSCSEIDDAMFRESPAPFSCSVIPDAYNSRIVVKTCDSRRFKSPGFVAVTTIGVYDKPYVYK